MSIDWKSIQTVAVKPFDSYKSSSANKLTYSIDEDGRGVIFGCKVSKQDNVTFKITHGVCLKDNTVIKYPNDVLLPLNETQYQNGNCYVVLRFKYIESRIEQFKYSSIDCIPVGDYDPVWHLILASCVITTDTITTVDDGDREYSDNQDHQKLNNLQGGNGLDEFFHLTQAQHTVIESILGDGVIDHNTELSGLDGGDGTHYYHLSQIEYTKLHTILSNGEIDHNTDLSGLDGGDGTYYYHLSQSKYNSLDDLISGNGAYVLKTGDTMTGILHMTNKNIKDLADPIDDHDAVNKRYLTTFFIDDSATDNIHAWSADQIITWVATHGGGGTGVGGAGISDPLRVTVDTTSTHTITLAYANSQIFFLEPDNIADSSGTPFVILRGGIEARLGYVGDTLELRRKSDKTLAATLVLHADTIDVTLGTNISNPSILVTYFESAVDNTFWDQFIKVDGTTSPTQNIDWGGKKITNLLDPGSAQDAATMKYVDDRTGSNETDPLSLHLTGGTMTGNIDMGGNNTLHSITNLKDPLIAQDAATKSYVDTNGGGVGSMYDYDHYLRTWVNAGTYSYIFPAASRVTKGLWLAYGNAAETAEFAYYTHHHQVNLLRNKNYDEYMQVLDGLGNSGWAIPLFENYGAESFLFLSDSPAEGTMITIRNQSRVIGHLIIAWS